MRKISLLVMILFLVSACTQEYPGVHRLVCESKRGTRADEEHFPDDLTMDWIQHSTVYARDNYIYKNETKVEFLIKDEAKEYLDEVLDGDQEALLAEVLKSFMYNDFEFVENSGSVDAEYFADRIVLEIKDHNPQRPETWKGIIVPEDYNFSYLSEKMFEYEDHCEIIKD